MLTKVNTASLSKIECAEILKTLRTALPDQEYRRVKNYLIAVCREADEEEIDSAIQGISEEDEFLLMSYLMGTATHLVPLFQRPVIKQGYIIPDLLASFQVIDKSKGLSTQKHIKYFVDVKSTSKDKCKVGGSKLKRLRDFSDHFGLPLLLAVRFTLFPRFPFWALVEDTDRSATSITIRLEDIMNGKRELLWNDYWFSLRQEGVSFKAVFTPEDGILTEDGILRHKDYGKLQQFDIIVNNLTVSRREKTEATWLYIFFEQLAEEESFIKEESVTTQILKPKMVVRSISDMVSRFNQLGRDDRTMPSSATKILLRTSQTSKRIVIRREKIEALVGSLMKVKLLKRFVRNGSMTLSKIEYDGWEELVVSF
ncbi:MAG: hypothetical protein IGR80_01225 [Synechococcales cyanobacterium K44_A2020_017]|nr:hypothetical protein [Synechococcales cyanobacterium K32_A2020_035]MBF2093365.1 hypothetical protein [Synechococcales cyanobacterium K44_A2020_017]